MSYLALYFVVGGLNYQLVTKPYYETHAGGLTVPPVQVVVVVESIRAVLIAFSVFLFLLSARGARRQLMISTGWLLFAIGGIIPLLLQIGSLPLFLLAASAVEIFFQNFFTGVVAAMLLSLESREEMKPPVVVKAGVA
jgi:ABC-type antimicrobial peptide transport system permease subunit